MPGLVPRLSGSCITPVEHELSGVEWRRRGDLTQARQVLSMHQVGTHETNEFEEAMFDFGYLLEHLQEQERDQCDRNLNAHRVFGAADKAGDFQRLLHQSKEQLDLPPPFI